MRIPNDKEFKKHLLENLKNFDEYCTKNDINYFLMYGSLIGAVRHNGFIPWDDDIDLIIPRPDYEKLIEHFNVDNSIFKLISTETNTNFTAPLAKIIDTRTVLIQKYGFKEKVDLGIYMDIFVLDGLPNDDIERKKHILKAKKLTGNWSIANHIFKYENSSQIKNIARYFKYFKQHLLGYKYYLKKIKQNAIKYKYDSSNYVGNLTFLNTLNEHFPKSYFEPIRMKFENIYVNVPKQYDKILTQLFGDYMSYPPIEEQISHHYYECYIKENDE